MAPRKDLERHRSSASSFLHRQFTTLSLSSRHASTESEEAVRGYYGLTALHEPAEALIDFIFVHGLRGGSRKTWSKTPNPAHFWPRAWLPLEPHFRNVRIHTFGYNSDWGTRKGSSVTVHDFGQALLAEIYTSPSAGGDDNDTPIIFVAHSMGGIVVKKVLILAKQDPNYQKLAARIHSMFFLATPHRGSDSAPLLRDLLQISGTHGAKAYVDNLVPNSEAIHTINDQFRHVYHDVQLWSFFETVGTSLGLIVEKDSAILGLPGERVQLLNADHRHVCKFDDPSDSNYLTLRNAFNSAITSIENTWSSMRREEHQSDMKRLSEYLGYLERPEAELSTLSDNKVEGSCEWLTDKVSFHSWREGFDNVPRLMWLRGDPATGKSTAVAHVIQYLENANNDCSYFFFRSNIKGKSTVAELLCSLAWQMASTNSVVRRKLLAMQDDGITIDLTDAATLWRTVFLSRIFRTELRAPHFWIIDALDESADYTLLIHFLAKIDGNVRLRVFLSSRPDLTMQRLFSQDKVAVTVDSTSMETSQGDIKMYLDAHAQDLPVESETERTDLVSRILEKSNGNFLWTSLVVQELEEDTVSQEGIVEILQSVPKGIDDLYSRIIRTVTARNRNGEVAKSILRWVACASRPLTIDELKEAVYHDIRQTVPQLDKNASSICGHLVYVDSIGRVHAKHQTVKDYLFRSKSAEGSGLFFDRAEEHGKIAEICLDFLCSDVMKTVRYRRTNMSARDISRPAFTNYAISYFSGHLSKASSSHDRHLITLDKFFLTNSLTWIELIAAQHDLSPLTETAKNLKVFMERRAKYRSPLGKEVQNVMEWADDLIRLVAQFGRALLSTPSSIHFLIPPVCPSGSIIFRNFAKYPRPLKLTGITQSSWDDRLSCITWADLKVLCIACGVNNFAIGLGNGGVMVYHEKTFQKLFQLQHGEQVRCLTFSHVRGLLAAAGRKKVNVWDLKGGVHIWEAKITDQSMAFEFTEDDSALMAGTRNNRMIIWETATGQELKNDKFSDFDEENDAPFGYSQPPIHAAFSPGLGLLGVCYQMRPITFWEIDKCTFAGQYHKAGASYHEPFVHSFLFNPIPDICLAAVAFQDGDIAVFNPWSQTTQATVDCDASCLASSPDGTILASGDGEGVIKLWDFETLRLLYQINSHEENIRSISFSVSGLRFYDIRGDHCNVWEPSILVRRVNSGDDSSIDQSERVADEPHYTTARATDEDLEITTFAKHQDGDFMFCGSESGAVKLYSIANGKQMQDIITHPDQIAILFLHWNEKQSFLASVDRTGRTLVHHVPRSTNVKQPFNVRDQIFEYTSSSAVQQILVDPLGKRLLLLNSEQVMLWDLKTSELVREKPVQESETLLWMVHPQNPEQLLLIRDGSQIETYSWASLTLQGQSRFSTADPDHPKDLRVEWAKLSSSSEHICAMLSDSHKKGIQSLLCVFPTKVVSTGNDLIPIATYTTLAKSVKAVIGCYKTMLLFLTHDDWVCSLNIDNKRQNSSYNKHFYIPQQWQGTRASTTKMLITKKGSVVLVSMDELAVFHCGLDFEEHMDLPQKKSTGSPKIAERPALKKNTSSPI
ncbi:hypothetical protein N0V90_001583 [Kalmusia sp. IMI 367209]|nr:hypothetical protein N0V90_001583 [Kalmusia sp. IMI 367209]